MRRKTKDGRQKTEDPQLSIFTLDPNSRFTMIKKATPEDAQLLTPIARQTLVESHGHSASAEDIQNYLDRKMTFEILLQDILDDANLYYIFYHDSVPVGYSKLILNTPNPNHHALSVAKLERIYFLQSHLGLGLAHQLLDFNVQLARENKQTGIWLNVWIENYRAIAFYKKNNFEIIGSYDFEVSPTHSNPNHVMYKIIR